ncbi:hypothetical protein L2750_14525 [Shewanella submarina]|uniref:Uncharacterized protein n=1 Tax=Shewanella submarina TaxID=2016376 RepID=A0ABV7G8J6_9GAMM|nr:hypothetical protein [Shewanella submarina]MCL1038346.1 hypothetical protein [Shewanella submarina]
MAGLSVKIDSEPAFRMSKDIAKLSERGMLRANINSTNRILTHARKAAIEAGARKTGLTKSILRKRFVAKRADGRKGRKAVAMVWASRSGRGFHDHLTKSKARDPGFFRKRRGKAPQRGKARRGGDRRASKYYRHKGLYTNNWYGSKRLLVGSFLMPMSSRNREGGAYTHIAARRISMGRDSKLEFPWGTNAGRLLRSKVVDTAFGNAVKQVANKYMREAYHDQANKMLKKRYK